MKSAIILFAVALSACGPEIRIHNDYDKAYSIQTYASFQWAKQKEIESRNNPLYYNELNDKRIKSAVNHELVNKGYALVTDSADFVLHYHIVIEDMSEIAPDPYNYHYGPGWPRSHTHIYRYREGTLIIDVMNPENKDLIWRGWATSALDEIYDPTQVEPLIQLAVSKILQKFPVHHAPGKDSWSPMP
jgi:hypothetical protein